MKQAAGWESSVTLRRWAAIAACAACPCAWAQADSAPIDMLAAAPEALPARLEVSTLRLPRLDGLDPGSSGPRLNLSLLPPRRSGLGLAVGMGGFAPPPGVAGQPTPASMNLDVGLHWRHTTDDNYQVDVTAWRRINPQPDAYSLVQLRQPTTYVARVELNLNSARRKGLVADRGFLGLQLENSARISLRRKNGGTMLYYRLKF